MKSIHDRPYYKKVYKKDSKNLKILIGHGSKQPKHAKKGSPYTQNPQKRRPVNKLSAPLMALDEELSPELKSAFMNIKDATIRFKTKKNIPINKNLSILAFKKDVFYNASIKGDQIETETNWTNQKLSKQEFLSKLDEQGEICDILDCDATEITLAGRQSQTLRQMMEAGAETAKGDKTDSQTTPEQPKEKGPVKQAQQAQSNAIVTASTNISKGGNIRNELHKLHKVGPYGNYPITNKIINVYYDNLEKSLKKIKDPNDTKIAALLGVVTGVTASELINIGAALGNELPIETAKEYFGEFVKENPGFLKAIDDLGRIPKEVKKIVKGAEDKAEEIKKTIDTIKKPLASFSGISSLPNAEEGKNEVMFMGNSQTWAIRSVFMPYLKTKGYTEKGKSFTGSGGTSDFHVYNGSSRGPGIPSAWITNPQKGKNFRKYTSENKNKIGLAVLSYGGSTFDAQRWQNEARQIVDYLREDNPNIQIVWVGAPPMQKYTANYENKNKKRKENNDAIKAVASEKSFVFIDPYEILSTDEDKSFYNKDGLHIGLAAARKILDGAKQGISIASLESAVEELTKKGKCKTHFEGGVELIKVDGKRGIKLPSGEQRYGGTLAWLNNNPGNIKYGKAWKREGAVGRAYCFATWATYEEGYAALKRYVAKYGFKSNHTILSFMKEYAPESDNNKPRQYASFITRRLKTKLGDDTITQDTRLSSFINNEAALEVFAQAIKQFEGYREGTIVPAQ